MKQSKFLLVMCTTTAVFLLTSCGGNNEKARTETSSSDSSSVAPTGKSTVITTPQTMLVVRHKVANFSKWKAAYDSSDSLRVAYGLHNYVIGRGLEDTNMVLVSLKADDAAKAKAFEKDPALKRAMAKGGVTGTPFFMLNELIYQDTLRLPATTARSLTWFNVKDWDAWKKAFESTRDIRLENGLTDRVYGHDVDDNHKVSLVTAVNDSAKATAFWKSDLLKQKRAESGVVGQPERFVFRVVQRY